jgi:hypothetical protein
MYTRLATERLKTGEEMEVGVVRAPDGEHTTQLTTFLGHKGRNWVWQVEKSLSGGCPDLESYFYVGKIKGQIVGNITTVEYNRTGIFGHVFTRSDQRMKGVCRAIMAHQMDDFRRRGGGMLLLGTGYESPPYWIYHRFGFRPLDKTGFMRYATEDDFEEGHFARCPAKVVEVNWRDWPRLCVLASIKDRGVLRSITFGLFGRDNLEEAFLGLKRGLEERPDQVRAILLQSERGAVVGCATIVPDHRWRNGPYLLDIFWHPRFSSYADLLISQIGFPTGKIQCYVDSLSPEKASFLERAGFEKEATLKGQIGWEGQALDVMIYGKIEISRSKL